MRGYTASLRYLIVAMLLLNILGCDSSHLGESPDGLAGSKRKLPNPTGKIVINGDYRAAILQIAEHHAASPEGSFVVIDFAVEYVGDGKIERWNVAKFRYLDSTGRIQKPKGESVNTMSQAIQKIDYFSFANVDSVKSKFDENAIIERQFLPGSIPFETTAIVVDFGVNDDSRSFTLPIDWK